MKSSVTSIALVLFLALSVEARAQEPQLTYRLSPGETYFLVIDLQQTTHSESMDSEEISFYSRTGLEFTADSMHSDLIYMSVQYRDLLISMLAPQMDIDISSSSGKNPMLTEMVKMLEQFTFHVAVSPAGELIHLEGMDKVFDPLASFGDADTSELDVILKTLEETYGPDAFKSFCNLFLWVYPVIHPMSNWTNDITYFFNTKPVNMVNRYILTRSAGENVVIQGMGMLNSSKEFFETTGMGDVKSTVSGSQTYDFQMDPETGWLKRCNSRQRVIIETTILKSEYFPPGLKIPSYTETMFEVTGGRMEESLDTKRK